MKEGYQREEYCSDQRKGSLRHFQPPKNLGSNFKAMLELLLRQNRGDECNRDISPTARDGVPESQLQGTISAFLLGQCGVVVVSHKQQPKRVAHSSVD